MKKWITVALLLGGCCGYAETLTINVTTEGPRKGVIAVLIFTSKKGWPSKNTVAFRKARFPVTEKGTIACSVTNLPYGSYSLSLLHDVNDNYKADKILGFGPPKEPVGFSNIPKKLKKKPRFEDTLIIFSATETEQNVSLFRVL
jgi:uncharacterized protein (DUF2141 family)